MFFYTSVYSVINNFSLSILMFKNESSFRFYSIIDFSSFVITCCYRHFDIFWVKYRRYWWENEQNLERNSWTWFALVFFPIKRFLQRLKTGYNRLMQDQPNMAGRLEQTNRFPYFFNFILAPWRLALSWRRTTVFLLERKLFMDMLHLLYV